jgi:hypothetical protein
MRRHSVSNALKYATVVLKNVKSMPIWSIAKDAQRSAEIALRNAEAWQARAFETLDTGSGEHTFMFALRKQAPDFGWGRSNGAADSWLCGSRQTLHPLVSRRNQSWFVAYVVPVPIVRGKHL